MSTVPRPRSVLNSASLHPAAWHALAVSARKPATDCRDDLAPGSYPIDVTLRVRGTLTVGHDSETASTVTPHADELLALVLAKLNRQTREKIFRELPAEFEASGGQLPPVALELVESASKLTEKLRRRVTQHRRGPVAGKFQVEASPTKTRKPAVSPLSLSPTFSVVG